MLARHLAPSELLGSQVLGSVSSWSDPYGAPRFVNSGRWVQRFPRTTWSAVAGAAQARHSIGLQTLVTTSEVSDPLVSHLLCTVSRSPNASVPAGSTRCAGRSFRLRRGSRPATFEYRLRG